MKRPTAQERKDKRELLLRREEVTLNDQNLRENASSNRNPNIDTNDHTKDISSKNTRAMSLTTENSSTKKTSDPNTVDMNDCHDYVTDKRNRVKKRKLEKSSEREGDLNSLDGVKILKRSKGYLKKGSAAKKQLKIRFYLKK